MHPFPSSSLREGAFFRKQVAGPFLETQTSFQGFVLGFCYFAEGPRLHFCVWALVTGNSLEFCSV